MISAYQTEQDDAECKDAVPDKKHEDHSDSNPEQDKTDQAFHKLLLDEGFYNNICVNEKKI